MKLDSKFEIARGTSGTSRHVVPCICHLSSREQISLIPATDIVVNRKLRVLLPFYAGNEKTPGATDTDSWKLTWRSPNICPGSSTSCFDL